MKQLMQMVAVLAIVVSQVGALQLKTVQQAKDDDLYVNPNQSWTRDALSNGTCEEQLNYTEEEMTKYMEYFSRKLEPDLFDKAMKIYENLTWRNPNYQGKLLVHTYELYDKAFRFPRVRHYEYAKENLDMLEHFEDNLNLNISNKKHLANFLRVATTVRKNFQDKYGGDGGFEDPADTDPYEEKEPEFYDFSAE